MEHIIRASAASAIALVPRTPFAKDEKARLKDRIQLWVKEVQARRPLSLRVRQAVTPVLMQRPFNREVPNQLWSGDITYIVTDEG